MTRATWIRTRSPRPKPRHRKDTGFSHSVKLAIRTRAGGGNPGHARCEACNVWLGAYGGQVQHRRARGRGGSRLAVTNSPANGALLCGTPQDGCHGLCEARDEHLHAAGWWIWSWQDPRAEPVMLHDEGGGTTVWLGADGTYWLSLPERAA
jgi:hypothetical protein